MSGERLREAGLHIFVTDVRAESLVQPSVPRLDSDEIHVWEFPLCAAESTFANYAQLLSPEEHARASRFHFDRDSRRFTIARAVVRAVLGSYSLSPASELTFVSAQHGKPALADSATDLRFNVSHSGDMGLLGIACGREIGVDIEAIRPDVETDKLAERFFSTYERESIRNLPEEQRIPAFFRCWSCKEAFLKAQGVGLSRSLGSFDVEVNPKRPAGLLATRPAASEAKQWALHEVQTVPGYAAAIATQGTINVIRILRCRP